MKLHYDVETDMLYISLNDKPGADAEEIVDGCVVDYGEDGRPVGIEIEHASKCLDLTKLETHSLPIAG